MLIYLTSQEKIAKTAKIPRLLRLWDVLNLGIKHFYDVQFFLDSYVYDRMNTVHLNYVLFGLG